MMAAIQTLFMSLIQWGVLLEKSTILSATNVDWEAISQNSQSVFVGDFGNNSGSRENLCIYEISKADIQDPSVNQVTAIRRCIPLRRSS